MVIVEGFESRGHVLLRIVVRHRSFPRREMSLEGVPEGLCRWQRLANGSVVLSQKRV